MPDTHTRKRRFQPPIDSFFARTDRDQWLAQSADSSSGRPPNSTPELPEHVQASLLSVGMRVRKAVPEGYKTHKTVLFQDPSSALTRAATTGTIAERQGELMPFCGLHKVGGLAVQEVRAVDALGERDMFEDPETGWFSSQESSVSALSADSAPAGGAVKGHKRSHSRVVNAGEDEEWEGLGVEEPVADVNMDTPLRQFAQPKSRQAMSRSKDPFAASLALSRNSLDWEEADFLEPWDQEMEGT